MKVKNMLIVKVYDNMGRIKLPVEVIRKMGLRRGSMLIVTQLTEDTLVLKKVESKIEELKNMGPELPEGIDEDKELEEAKILVYELL